MEPIHDVLVCHPFLRGMQRHHLETLADCAVRTQFCAGDIIFREGEVANRFYLIENGQIALEHYEASEHRILEIQTVGAGEALGWSWLFPPYYWHFDARVLEPTRALCFFATRLRERCEEDPMLGYQLVGRVAQVVIQRLQATQHKLVELERRVPV